MFRKTINIPFIDKCIIVHRSLRKSFLVKILRSGSKILIRLLFLLPNFMGLVNYGDLNEGFSYSVKLFYFGKFFLILSS